MCKHILDIGEHVHFIVQGTQDGFGHAVWCARNVMIMN